MMKAEKVLRNPWIVAVLAVFCCALWGSAFPFIKIGYQLYHIPSDAPGAQILFAGIRFTLAGAMAILFGSLVQRKWISPKKSAWGKIFRLSLLQTALQYFFFYIGLAHTSGVKGSIIVGTNSLLSILIASLLFHQAKMRHDGFSLKIIYVITFKNHTKITSFCSMTKGHKNQGT